MLQCTVCFRGETNRTAYYDTSGWQCATPPLLIPPANPSAGLLSTVITHPPQCYTSPHTGTPGTLHTHVHTCKPTHTCAHNMNLYPALNFIWLWLLNVKCVNWDYGLLHFVPLMINFTETPPLLRIIILFDLNHLAFGA